MLISEIKKPLTVSSLSEIISSQLSCFNDQPLIVRPSMEFVTGEEIFIGHDILLCCMSDEEMAEDQITLSYLLKQLNKHEANEKIFYRPLFHLETFSVGFIIDGELTEVFSTDEIEKK